MVETAFECGAIEVSANNGAQLDDDTFTAHFIIKVRREPAHEPIKTNPRDFCHKCVDNVTRDDLVQVRQELARLETARAETNKWVGELEIKVDMLKSTMDKISSIWIKPQNIGCDGSCTMCVCTPEQRSVKRMSAWKQESSFNAK